MFITLLIFATAWPYFASGFFLSGLSLTSHMVSA